MANPYHDEKGRFTFAEAASAGAAALGHEANRMRNMSLRTSDPELKMSNVLRGRDLASAANRIKMGDGTAKDFKAAAASLAKASREIHRMASDIRQPESIRRLQLGQASDLARLSAVLINGRK